MGPVLFVFDVSDTAPLPNARPLPPQVEDPFQVRNGKIGGQLGLTIENAKRDGVRVSERADGSQRAGSIQWAAAGQHLEFTIAKKPLPKSTQVPLWFELLLNSVLSAEARYGTLVHELAHLYCGHLGTPNARWWPDRQNQSHAVREFEAESVSYLVCTRLGIDTASDEYLAAFNNARQIKDQTKAVELILKHFAEFKDPVGQLGPVIVAVNDGAKKSAKSLASSCLSFPAFGPRITSTVGIS